MKITIQNGELEQKVGIALKGVNGRNSTKPILKCIIIKAKEDEILLEATNLEIGLCFSPLPSCNGLSFPFEVILSD